MGFDVTAFNKAKMENATAELHLPSLQQFFGEDKPIWIVRGMTHTEICRMQETKHSDKLLNTAIAAVAGSEEDKAKIIREFVGDTNGIHESTRRCIEQLVMCSVAPKIDRPIAVRLSQFYPTEFDALCRKIFQLTDDGPTIAKKKQLQPMTR
ncbi:hypothetical protein J2Y86_000925 [Pseudomonas migulae]|uniref:hypothetical protein n=1 Tax=Pseudomonas migulae TaxID=78543 RepID=UPI0020A1597A|nr:hypothetical protein [Pseudomonas migulae]MCP1496218.1 hypothetical protein [Pseudomonas migulae]